jgi:hypothetical protein
LLNKKLPHATKLLHTRRKPGKRRYRIYTGRAQTLRPYDFEFMSKLKIYYLSVTRTTVIHICEENILRPIPHT